MIDKKLVLANVCETVTEEELDEVLKKKNPVVYCGYETSGRVHVGHMVTVTKLLDFAKAGFKVKVLFADIHTRLNRKGSEDWIDEMVEYWRQCFKAMGLVDAEYVLGSDFQLTPEYTSDVLKISLNTTMNRALRSMQEVARDIENARVSQVIYPLMQIVDVKALGADVAYGGLEQRKIHMLAREILPEVGYRKPVCIHTPLLCSLGGPDSKMSSSKPETIIAVDETAESIVKKVNSAFCPPETEGNPVLDICRLLLFPRRDVLEVVRPEKYGGNKSYDCFDAVKADYISGALHPADLKKATGAALSDVLKPVRSKLSVAGVQYPKN